MEENLPANTRRERVKLNQRAYRRRHASKFKTLQQRSERLRTALREVTDAASASGQLLHSDLVAALESSRQLLDEDGGDEDAVQAAKESRDNAPSQPQNVPSSSTIRELPFPATSHIDPWSTSVNTSSSLPMFSGPLSPRLDYGLWPDSDPLIKTFSAPSGIGAYLGPAQSTLGGYLFWCTHTFLQSMWDASGLLSSSLRSTDNNNNNNNNNDDDDDDDNRASAQKQAAARRLIRATLSHSRHLTDHAALAVIGRARLAFRRQGYLRLRAAEHATVYHMPEVLHQQIIREMFGGYTDTENADIYRVIADNGTLPPPGPPFGSLWMTPQQVESYIFGNLTPDESALVRTYVAHPGLATCEVWQRGVLDSFFGIMGRNHMCFGSGPRWNSVLCAMAVASLTQCLRRDDRNAEGGFVPT